MFEHGFSPFDNVFTQLCKQVVLQDYTIKKIFCETSISKYFQKTEEDVLNSVLNLIRLLETRREFLPTVSRLFSSLTNRNSRSILCEVLQVT